MTSFEGDWNDEDPRSLARRVERALRAVREHGDGDCGRCGKRVCGHLAIFALVAGDPERPLCLECLARTHDREAAGFRDSLASFAQSKPCLSQGWRYANVREGFSPEATPTCLWEEDPAVGHGPPGRDTAAARAAVDSGRVPEPAATWDAGLMACGDLVLELRMRMRRLEAGDVLYLRATDPAAPVDIPSWCRLTGETLVAAEHPKYFIRRKEER